MSKEAWFDLGTGGWHRGAQTAWCGKRVDYTVARTRLDDPADVPFEEQCRDCLGVQVGRAEDEARSYEAEAASSLQDAAEVREHVAPIREFLAGPPRRADQ